MLAVCVACRCAARTARSKTDDYTCRTARRRLADGGSNPPSSTTIQKTNRSRLVFFRPFPPVLARFPGMASRAPPLRSRRFRPHRRLSVLRFLWWSRERSRGHFLCWRGFRGAWLWLATPVAVATQDGRLVDRYAVGCSRPQAVLGALRTPQRSCSRKEETVTRT